MDAHVIFEKSFQENPAFTTKERQKGYDDLLNKNKTLETKLEQKTVEIQQLKRRIKDLKSDFSEASKKEGNYKKKYKICQEQLEKQQKLNENLQLHIIDAMKERQCEYKTKIKETSLT